MNRVKRAIIMAAGLGKRMYPLTEKIPKPLIKVNGIPMIETIIDGLHEHNIRDIYIVTGYLKDKFDYLKDKYEGIKLIGNPHYNCCNNISSLYCVRNYISEAIIIDGDQIVKNREILAPEFEKSGYNAVWTETETKEWLLQVKDNKIISCSRTGGKQGWQLYSISRWTKEDGEKLKKHVEEEFVKNTNTDIYWDDVAMFCHFEEYDLGIRPMSSTDLIEIDDIEELISIDKSYEQYGKKELDGNE